MNIKWESRIFRYKKRVAVFLINHFFTGVRPCFFPLKRQLLNHAGLSVGEGTKVVGNILIYGTMEAGKNSYINYGFTIHGNGHVKIGNCCDIAPEVAFLTGGHEIGGKERRAGEGETYSIIVEDGVWIGARATLVRNIIIGHGSVVAAGACVIDNVPPNVLVGGGTGQGNKESYRCKR